MSSHGVSKSTSLKGPKFDDEIDVKRVFAATPVPTWKLVPCKAAPSKEETFKLKESQRIETANRFDLIKDKSCDLDLVEPKDINNRRNLKSENDNKRRNKKKTKKDKRPKDKKQKCCSNYLSEAKKSPVGPCVPKAERCSMCLVSHTPFYKFCRWARKSAEQIQEKIKYEDKSGGSKKEISLSKELIEIIQSRIKVIEEQVSFKPTPTLSTQEQDKKKKLQKKIISSAEACAKKFLAVSEDKTSIIKYCSKKISKIMKINRIPESNGYQSIQSVISTFDKIYYNSQEPEAGISQLDGNDEIFDEDKEVPNLYGINCEISALTVWINFLRGFNNIWEERDNHDLCPFYPKQESCFFCLMRSLHIRSNCRGKTGPKSVKPFEAAYALGQLEKNGFNWKCKETSTIVFIEEALKQLSRLSKDLKQKFAKINLVCSDCGTPRGFIEENVTNLNTDNLTFPVTMGEIFNQSIRKTDKCSCKNAKIITEDSEKMIIISFSSPVNIDVSKEFIHFGRTWCYQSHVKKNSSTETSFFERASKMMFQDDDGKIKEDDFGFHLGVKIIAFSCNSEYQIKELPSQIYDAKIQLYLRKQYNSVVNTELYEQNIQKTKQYEQNRGKTRDKEEKRLAEKRKHDQERDKEEKRLTEKRKHDQERDK